MLQASDGRFYGCHPNSKNICIWNTLFPLVTVKKDDIGSPSQLVQFGTLKQVSPGRTSVTIERPIKLTQLEFGSMIDDGDRLSEVSGASVQVVDITKPLSARCAADIAATGLIKLPPVFAIVTKKP